MITINFAKKEQIKLISEFEINEFSSEAYSFDMLNDMMKDNYLLKDNDNIFVLLDDEDLIGYIIFHISKDFTDIFKIFIRDNDKRKGYATMLLNKVNDLAKRYNSHKLMVEVRAKNLNAINFYKKNNFEQISIRDKYYKNPTDDALIFERSL